MGDTHKNLIHPFKSRLFSLPWLLSTISEQYKFAGNNMSNCFRWLHFSDLHWKTDSHEKHWDLEIKKALFDDIKKISRPKKIGSPWDAVFFTGDLVNHGSVEQFQELTKELREIFQNLNVVGSEPLFICIPGNHDLVRPDSHSSDFEIMTENWFKKDDRRQLFWKKDGKAKSYWDLIDESFKNFREWAGNLSKNGFLMPENVIPGLLPGEFGLTIKKIGRKIGIIGLNSAAFHLSDNSEGKLDCDPFQITHICNNYKQENKCNWFDDHDLNIILTHHPEDWFHTVSESSTMINGKTSKSNSRFNELAPLGRFALHLFGHMHEHDFSSNSPGGSDQEFRLMQATSLFGIEKLKNGNDRRHGYCAGKIEFNESEALIRSWPRAIVEKRGGTLEFDKDPSSHYDPDKDDEGTYNQRHPLRKKQSSTFSKAENSSSHSPSDDALIKRIKDDEGLLRKISSEIENLISYYSDQKKIWENLYKNYSDEQFQIDKHPSVLADFIIKTDIVVVIDHLSSAFDTIKKNTPSKEIIKQTFEVAEKILGWCVLRAVREDWIRSNFANMSTGDVGVELNLPLIKSHAWEITFSRLFNVMANLRGGKCSGRMIGLGFDFGIEESDPGHEDGFDITDTVDRIKKEIFVVLCPEVDVKEYTDEYLNTRLRIWNKNDPRFFPFQNSVGSDAKALKQIGVQEKIKKDLNSLNFLLFSKGNDTEVLFYGEQELSAYIDDFLTRKPIY